jgi:hypothetical protein
VWSWYWVGVAAGVGAALGVIAVALVGARGARLALGSGVGVAAGIGLGLLVGDWPEAAGGGVGALLGTLGTAPTLRGTLKRGGTRGATAALLVAGSIVVAALAFVPILGYLLAVAVPLAGARARRRSPERYAGLRTLAR